ncbi:hypothetical protein FH972_025737 [Carpinus fangiana]|uniref:PH domain-containing protein n=1 Tax=Carpinus fangiana TaxID=176857 RepID=A0A5N6L2W2_9ROSI|nr:hypothetical protein FH972_025737 [Carpinus fangiana]
MFAVPKRPRDQSAPFARADVVSTREDDYRISSAGSADRKQERPGRKRDSLAGARSTGLRHLALPSWWVVEACTMHKYISIDSPSVGITRRTNEQQPANGDPRARDPEGAEHNNNNTDHYPTCTHALEGSESPAAILLRRPALPTPRCCRRRLPDSNSVRRIQSNATSQLRHCARLGALVKGGCHHHSHRPRPSHRHLRLRPWQAWSNSRSIAGLQPHKKSINFAVFKHPGTANGTAPSLPSVEHSGPTTPAPTTTPPDAEAPSQVHDKLHRLGMTCVAWIGRCEAHRVTMGSYDVPPRQSGMYGLVFDNTHSKQTSKTVTFVLMTYPTSSPPQPGHHLHFAQAMARQSSNSLHSNQSTSPRMLPISDSSESLHDATKVVLAHPKPRSLAGTETKANGDTFYTGVLSKKRRKRNQGHARRFFSLDFTSSTLSYYKNRNSSALRGAVPLSMAAVATDEKSRTISVDSGTDVWLLRAPNAKDFKGWRDALERASNQAHTIASPRAGTPSPARALNIRADLAEDREWNTVESLVGRVAGITDAVRRLAKDTDPKYSPGGFESPATTDYFQEAQTQKPSFWRRKSSATSSLQAPATTSSNRRSISGRSLAPPSPNPSATVHLPKTRSPQEEDVHGHCMAVLRDLDAVVAQFSNLIQESKQRRVPERPAPISRHSMESAISQEFFDAEDDGQLLTIRRGSESPERPTSIMHDSGSDSDRDDEELDHSTQADRGSGDPLFPSHPKSIAPLGSSSISSTPRRTTIPASTGPPPSLISFLRKNVGKDLTQIAMPVTANEPLSLLQRQAELLEYSSLLDAAAHSLSSHQSPSGASSTSLDDAATQRLLYVTAFAISSISCNRDKARATRKPFNPLLGETFELVRPDLGWRFVAEKVSHRPVRVACAAESVKGWAFAAAVAPDQKFWGKSAEIITDGRVRVSLFGADAATERYSWTPPTCFLRNIIAGEKYVEPVGTFTVTEESSGRRALVTFKAGGVFSGRSEEVSARAFAPGGAEEQLGLAGKWTQSLALTPGGEELWRVGAMVSPDPQSRFGLTAFAASLNEITAVEEGHVPSTDSRLRPDQRAYEEGRVGEAETLKAKLEEAQRERRKDGTDLVARWFEAVPGHEEKEWRRKDGDDEGSYWKRREGTYGWGGERERGDIFKV